MSLPLFPRDEPPRALAILPDLMRDVEPNPDGQADTDEREIG
jgi:hypothetical protein